MKLCISASLILHTGLALLICALAATKPVTKEALFIDVADVQIPPFTKAAQKALTEKSKPAAGNSRPAISAQPVQASSANVTAAVIHPQEQRLPVKTPETGQAGNNRQQTTTASTGSKPSAAKPTALPQSQPKHQPAGEIQFGSAAGPAFAHRVQPIYPHIARRFGREGTVLLRLSINEKGALSDIEILKDPGHGFTASAIEALRKSSFIPATNNGVPIKVKAVLPVRFALQNN